MIEITIGCKNRCAKPLGCREYRFIVITDVTHISEKNRLMPTRRDECGGGHGKVLIKQELHGAATSSRSA